MYLNIFSGSVRSVVYQAAERTIIEASCFVFANAWRGNASEVVEISELNQTNIPIKVRTNNGGGPSAVCAVKVLKFFIDILQRSCGDEKAVNGGPTKRTASSSAAGATSIAVGSNSSGSPNGTQSIRHNVGYGGNMIDAEARDLLFTIRAINAIFLAEGDLDGSRSLISKYVFK